MLRSDWPTMSVASSCRREGADRHRMHGHKTASEVILSQHLAQKRPFPLRASPANPASRRFASDRMRCGPAFQRASPCTIVRPCLPSSLAGLVVIGLPRWRGWFRRAGAARIHRARAGGLPFSPVSRESVFWALGHVPPDAKSGSGRVAERATDSTSHGVCETPPVLGQVPTADVAGVGFRRVNAFASAPTQAVPRWR